MEPGRGGPCATPSTSRQHRSQGELGTLGTHLRLTAAAAACGRASSAVSAACLGHQGCLGRKGQSPGWDLGLPKVQAEDKSDPPARKDGQRGKEEWAAPQACPHWSQTGGAVFLGPHRALTSC